MGRRIVEFSDSILPLFFEEGVHHYRIKQGLPKDVKIVNAIFEFSYRSGPNRLQVLVESGEWEGPKDGEPYPRIDLMYETIYKDRPEWDGP